MNLVKSRCDGFQLWKLTPTRKCRHFDEIFAPIAQEVVILTTSGSSNGENSIKMVTFQFQYIDNDLSDLHQNGL